MLRSRAIQWTSLYLAVVLSFGGVFSGCGGAGGSDSSSSDSAAGAEDDVVICDVPEACGASPCPEDAAGSLRPLGWQEASHCQSAEADYDLLFDDSEPATMVVHRFDILVEEEVYQQTMDDLQALYGFSTVPPPPLPRLLSVDEDPVWVPVTVQYNGLTWDRVGMRYKGNSSLQAAYQSGIKKLAFRLDFDQFEDDYPEIINQRFFGFKKMTFSNGYKDPSLIRDKISADIFRRAGVPAARGAFARVYVTIGEQEPVYFGLYTMIEDPANKMLDTQFGDDHGNLYKPEDTNGSGAANWLNSASDQEVAEDFVKKTNEDEGDWSDVLVAIAALHSDDRTTHPSTWRSSLESVFHVDGFLRLFAVNQVIVNWDSYGCMAHNYYLYADPSDATHDAPGGRLTWFPWDLNEAMLSAGLCDFSDADGLIPDAGTVGAQWPVIRFLLDDSTYADRYEELLAETVSTNGAFDAGWVRERVTAYHELIAPYVVGPAATESGDYTFLRTASEFLASEGDLRMHVESRHQLVNSVLSAMP